MRVAISISGCYAFVHCCRWLPHPCAVWS